MAPDKTEQATEVAESDLIVAELQDYGRQREALKERGREAHGRLRIALIREGKALSEAATADLRDREARARVRAELDALDAADDAREG